MAGKGAREGHGPGPRQRDEVQETRDRSRWEHAPFLLHGTGHVFFRSR